MFKLIFSVILYIITISIACANSGNELQNSGQLSEIKTLENKITQLENRFQLVLTGSKFNDYEKILVESKYMSDKQRYSYEVATENFTTWMNWFIWIFGGAFLVLLIVLGIVKWKDFEISAKAIKNAEARMLDIESRLIKDVLRNGIQDKLNDIFSDKSKVDSLVLELTKEDIIESIAKNIFTNYKGQLNGKITEVLTNEENKNGSKIINLEKRVKIAEDQIDLLSK